jgi:hypothetical protein
MTTAQFLLGIGIGALTGVLAMLIGLDAARHDGATGSGSGSSDAEASQSGAISAIAESTGGALLLWVMAAGLVLYAAWLVGMLGLVRHLGIHVLAGMGRSLVAAIGALAAAVLVVNNHRDIAHDTSTGRRTFGVLFGPRASAGLYSALILAPFAMVPLLVWQTDSQLLWLPLLLLPGTAAPANRLLLLPAAAAPAAAAPAAAA